jgi:hypothetical protein
MRLSSIRIASYVICVAIVLIGFPSPRYYAPVLLGGWPEPDFGPPSSQAGYWRDEWIGDPGDYRTAKLTVPQVIELAIAEAERRNWRLLGEDRLRINDLGLYASAGGLTWRVAFRDMKDGWTHHLFVHEKDHTVSVGESPEAPFEKDPEALQSSPRAPDKS